MSGEVSRIESEQLPYVDSHVLAQGSVTIAGLTRAKQEFFDRDDGQGDDHAGKS